MGQHKSCSWRKKEKKNSLDLSLIQDRKLEKSPFGGPAPGQRDRKVRCLGKSGEYWRTRKSVKGSSDFFYFCGVCCFWVRTSLRGVGGHQEWLIIPWMMWSSELKACHADLCVFSLPGKPLLVCYSLRAALKQCDLDQQAEEPQMVCRLLSANTGSLTSTCTHSHTPARTQNHLQPQCLCNYANLQW